jgi:4a-hydroxytetrahydrobiopterin dehydratase
MSHLTFDSTISSHPNAGALNYLGASHGLMAKLSDSQVELALGSLPGWKRTGEYLVKEFKFKEFLGGIRFVDAVAKIAEAQEHHPDIHVVWTTVTLRITTHDEGGLTKWDVALAKAIEKHGARGKKSAK